MKYAVILAAIAGFAAAAPGTPLTRRVGPRRPGPRSRPMIKAEAPRGSNNTEVGYSQNWSGVIQETSGVTQITGTIVVPEASGGYDAGASAWVGIDGANCRSGLLQTGITFYGDGTYDAWYEWIPNAEVDFPNFPVNTGDEIQMTVVATSTTSGTATLKNLSTGKSVSHTFTNPPSSLCLTDAEWIVEDFDEDGNEVPFADYGRVTFTDASAKTSSGTITPAGGQVVYLRTQQGDVLSECSLSGSNVNCEYTG